MVRGGVGELFGCDLEPTELAAACRGARTDLQFLQGLDAMQSACGEPAAFNALQAALGRGSRFWEEARAASQRLRRTSRTKRARKRLRKQLHKLETLLLALDKFWLCSVPFFEQEDRVNPQVLQDRRDLCGSGELAYPWRCAVLEDSLVMS